MIWAIDPLVFELAAPEPRCAVALEHIAENIEKAEYLIALDGNGLFEKYIEIFESCLVDPSPNVQPIIRILAPIMKGLGASFSVPIDTPISAELEDIYDGLIDMLDCRSKVVESQLLTIALNSRKEGGVSVLIPEEELLERHDFPATKFYTPTGMKEIVKALWRKMGIRENDCWFQIKNINDIVKVGEHAGHIQSPAHAHSEKFEIKTLGKLRRELGCYDPEHAPSDVEQEAGQVDVYIAHNDIFWVGECKLRDRGNEGKLLNGEEMRKLCRVVDATVHSQNPKEITGYLISNADDVHEYAKEVLRSYIVRWCEYSGVSIQIAFRKAILPKRWSRQDSWGVRLEPPQILFKSEP